MIAVKINNGTVDGGSEFEGTTLEIYTELVVICHWIMGEISKNEKEFNENRQLFIDCFKGITYDDVKNMWKE